MAISPIYFTDYNNISDTIMWFNNQYSLKFNVGLKHKNANGDQVSFHSEPRASDGSSMNIKRNYKFFFTIEDKEQFTNNVLFRPSDVEMLKLVIRNNIYPWFIGDKVIFGHDKDGKIIIKGNYNEVKFPLNDQKYIIFYPIVLEFEDHSTKQGIRIVMNNSENFFDISIDKFLEFAYYINNTDMVNAAMNMLTYVKTKPYGVNVYEYEKRGNFNTNRSKGYFD